ncbi:MAG: sugar ABC transporter permease [Chloroflexi bacterium]|nr:sugar ABC transporter permease [Chloroflexota bacterium]
MLFLAPSFVFFAIFWYYPLLASAYISLTKWNIVAPTKPFVGLLNYERLFADPRFMLIIKNTAFYSIGVVGTSMLLGLGLAVLLNRKMVARGLYRTAIFTPYVTSLAAVSLLWTWIFDPQFGLMNAGLRALLIPAPGWLSSPEWALPAIMVMAVWHSLGYNMVIFLAGLQNVPEELNEAARIDGATGPRLFWHITLPLLSPTTFFLVVTGLIASFQVFDAVAVMTQGGPLDSTNVFVFYLYQNAFQFFEMGYASAIAMVLFAIVIVLTAIQMVASRRWVHYG